MSKTCNDHVVIFAVIVVFCRRKEMLCNFILVGELSCIVISPKVLAGFKFIGNCCDSPVYLNSWGASSER